TGAFRASDVGLAGDRRRGHGPTSRQAMAARDDEHQLVLHPGFRSESGHERRFADHSQLQLTHGHRALDLPGIADLEPQGDPGIRRMEPRQRGRQEVGAGSRAGADREGARPKPAHLARRLLGGTQQREGLARVWLYRARRRSRPYALPVTLDESDAKVRFQSTQVLGDGGLADVAGLGGAAHPAMVQDGEEQLEAVHREAGLDHNINPIKEINNSYLSYGTTYASFRQFVLGAERPRRSS